MSFTLVKKASEITAKSPGIISWDTPCHFCQKPIGSGSLLVIMSLKQAALMGVSHVECGYNDFRYAQFPLRVPGALSAAQISFLTQFYPRLFKLPGWGQSRSALRRCLASLILDFPEAWSNPACFLQRFVEENPSEIDLYAGDLGTDFFNFLGEVHRDARENPINIELNFGN